MEPTTYDLARAIRDDRVRNLVLEATLRRQRRRLFIERAVVIGAAVMVGFLAVHVVAWIVGR